jgi:hypothetical protein
VDECKVSSLPTECYMVWFRTVAEKKNSGPNWIDYLTFDFNETETLAFNFAYGGATIDAALVAPYTPEVLSLKQQVEDLFLGVLQPQKSQIAPDWTAGNSLFLIWIGINDIGGSYWSHPNDDDGFQTTLMDEYFRLVDEVNALLFHCRGYRTDM